jgi:hypothetical protein
MPRIKLDVKKTLGTAADGRRTGTQKGGMCKLGKPTDPAK